MKSKHPPYFRTKRRNHTMKGVYRSEVEDDDMHEYIVLFTPRERPDIGRGTALVCDC